MIPADYDGVAFNEDEVSVLEASEGSSGFTRPDFSEFSPNGYGGKKDKGCGCDECKKGKKDKGYGCDECKKKKEKCDSDKDWAVLLENCDLKFTGK